MERKYALLRVLGNISKILGIITGVLTILGAIGACAGAFVGSGVVGPYLDQIGLGFGQGQYVQMVMGIVTSVLTLLYGGSIAIALYALGQGVQLLIDVEKNTRTIITMLQG
jgi:hypothetical protein